MSLPPQLSHKRFHQDFLFVSAMRSPPKYHRNQVCVLLQSIHESCRALSQFSMWLKHDPILRNDHHVPPLSRAFAPSIIRSQTTPTSPATINNPYFSIQGLIIEIHGKIFHYICKLTLPFPTYGPSSKCSNEIHASYIWSIYEMLK